MPSWTLATLPDGFRVTSISPGSHGFACYIVHGHGRYSDPLDPNQPGYQQALDRFVDATLASYQAQPATADDRTAIADTLLTEKLAAVPVTRGHLSPILQQLLAEAAAAIPFFEQYARDPAMDAEQWLEFQQLPWDPSGPRSDAWTADGEATGWPLSAPLDQTQPFTLTVDGAQASVAVAAGADGATSDYVLVEQADGSWLLECATVPAPAAGDQLTLAYSELYPQSKARLLYDALRSLAALMRYLTGELAAG